MLIDDDGCTAVVMLLQVSLILNDNALFEEWKRDIKTMAERIIEMRKELHRLLTEELKTPGNWDHIVNQIGMFRYVEAHFGSYLCARSGLAVESEGRGRACVME